MNVGIETYAFKKGGNAQSNELLLYGPTIYAVWCELFKFIAMTFEFAQCTAGLFEYVCLWVIFFLFMFPNTLRQWDKFSRWQNGSAFSDGSIKSINFYWTFVFQVCPVQCSGKSRKRSFTLPLCCTIYNFAKMPAIVNETNALKIRKNKNDAYTFKRWIYWC